MILHFIKCGYCNYLIFNLLPPPLRLCDQNANLNLNPLTSYLKNTDKVRFRALQWRIVFSELK